MSSGSQPINTGSFLGAASDAAFITSLFGWSGLALAGVATGLGKINEELKTSGLISEDFAKYISPFGSIAYWNKQYDAIRDSNQALGIAGLMTKQIEQNTIDAYRSTIKYGGEIEDITESYTDFSNAYGRNISLNAKELDSLSKIKTVLGKNASGIQNISVQAGKSIAGLDRILQDMVKQSGDVGVTFSKAFDNMSENIGLIDNYSFKSGIKGTAKMAINAEKTRISMQSTANTVDKFLNFDTGIEAMSQLTMLGGQFSSQFGDIFQVTYDARNNPEKIQQRLHDITKDIATINKETGEIYIDPYSFDQLRVAANALGIDVSELSQAAKSSFKESSIENLFSMGIKGKENFDQIKSMVAGMATLENGEWSVNVDGTKKSISSIDENDLIKLKPYEEASRDYLADIAQSNKSVQDSLDILVRMGLNQLMDPAAYQLIDQRVEGALKSTTNIFGEGSVIGDTYRDMSNEAMKNLFDLEVGYDRNGLTGIAVEMGKNLSANGGGLLNDTKNPYFDTKTGKPIVNKSNGIPTVKSMVTMGTTFFDKGNTFFDDGSNFFKKYTDPLNSKNGILNPLAEDGSLSFLSNDIDLSKVIYDKIYPPENIYDRILKQLEPKKTVQKHDMSGKIVIENIDGSAVTQVQLERVVKDMNFEGKIKQVFENAAMFNAGKNKSKN